MPDYTVTQAGFKMGRSYNQVLRMLLVGELPGYQTDDGRWLVRREAVEKRAQERAAQASPC